MIAADRFRLCGSYLQRERNCEKDEYKAFQGYFSLRGVYAFTIAQVALLVEACKQIEARGDAVAIARWTHRASSWEMRRGGYHVFVLLGLMMMLGKQGRPPFIDVYNDVLAAEGL